MNEGTWAPPADKPKRHAQTIAFILLAVMVVLGATSSSLLYLTHRKDQRIINATGVSGTADTQNLVNKVSRLMLLPAHERPTVATVTDTDKLPHETFFRNSHNGDKVLIYSKAKTAIMYDPNRNLVVAVSALRASR